MTVVPTATTRPPRRRAAATEFAVSSGTRYHSSIGGSSRSGLATPACSVTGARPMPWAAARASSSRVNARPADGISADPGTRAYTVWYASSGHSPRT